MLKALLNFNNKHHLFFNKNTLIVGVSGGVDSMVLLKLLASQDLYIIVAHCNFQLRGKEADEDQKFVEKTVLNFKNSKIIFESINFETEKYAKENKLSIQEAARDLRYNWFEKLRQKHKAQAIVTAHHLNDNTETLLYNISKGTGIKGMRGMLPKNGKIIRPMLAVTKQEIENFAEENKIDFRKDSSNDSLKYNRNLIRKKIVPEFEKVNSNFDKTLRNHFERFRDIELFYSEIIKKWKKELFEHKNDDFYISILKLKKTKGFKTLLFEIIAEYGFNIQQVEDIIRSLELNESKIFYAGNYRIIKAKKHLILSDTTLEKQNYFEVSEKQTKIKLPNKELLEIHVKPFEKLTKMSDKNHFAYLDMDKLQFPLVLRRWKDGDYFYPYGMYSDKGKAKKKKLKKYFADLKLNLVEKENIWILAQGDKIVWLVNHRIDDRFKITEETKKVFQLKIKQCKN